MAYVAGDYRFSVFGNFDNGESWINRWAVRNIDTDVERDAAGAAIRDFYAAAYLADVSSHTQAVAAQAKNLFTDTVTDLDWETVVGDDLADLLPTQCSVRISLNSQSGVNGGPFLAGFSVNAVDANGDLLSGNQTILIGAVDALADDLDTAGVQLAIERPTVPELVTAARARVGARLDVIRKRANDRMESYAVADLL